MPIVEQHSHDSDERGSKLKPEKGLRDVTARAGELNSLTGAPTGSSFTVNPAAGDEVTVDVQLQDGTGAAISEAGHVMAYLSDSPLGDGVAAIAPSGGVAEAQGKIIAAVVVGLAFWLQSEDGGNGAISLEITEAAAKTFYLVIVLSSGKHVASPAITFPGP